MEKLLLSVQECADLLGLGKSKVYELLAAGEIESCKVGLRARRIPFDALEAYVARIRNNEKEES